MSTKLTFNPIVKTKIIYPYTWWDGFFDNDTIDKIIELCSTYELTTGKISQGGGGVAEDDSIRQSKISLIKLDQENRWLFEILARIAEFMNDSFYHFDLTGFDHFQYTVYEEGGDKYEYHTDMIFGEENHDMNVLPRKLSLSICLNDPSEYEGGQFQLCTGGSVDIVAEQAKGRVLAFPSFVLHRVTPVTKGVRRSLVVWVLGNKFK